MWEKHRQAEVVISRNFSGLGNRLKSLASAIRLNPNHRVIWPRNRLCNCSFGELFENDIEVSMKQFKIWKKNERVLCENGKEMKAEIYQAWRIATIKEDKLPKEFNSMGRGYNNWRWSGKLVDMEYNRTPDNITKDITACFSELKPRKELLLKIKDFSLNNFKKNTVSVQIRTCEKDALGELWSKKRHRLFSLEPYISLMKEYVSSGRDAFFVSTDRQSVIQELKNIFGNKIIVYPRQTIVNSSRGSQEGMQETLVELYLLSKNKYFIGTFPSTFSEVAWWLSDPKPEVKIIASKHLYNGGKGPSGGLPNPNSQYVWY